MKKEENTNIKTLGEIDLIKEIKINNEKMVISISDKMQEILYKYFNEEIIKISLESSSISFNFTQFNFDKGIKFKEEFLVEIYEKFLEKIVLKNYLKIFEDYESFIVENENEITAVLVFGLLNLRTREERFKQIRKTVVKITKCLDKRIFEYMKENFLQNPSQKRSKRKLKKH